VVATATADSSASTSVALGESASTAIERQRKQELLARKARERRAQKLVNEIIQVRLNQNHCPPINGFTVASQAFMEEHLMKRIENGGANEEDKYAAYFPFSSVGVYSVRSGTMGSFVGRTPIFHGERERISLLPLPHLRLAVLQSRHPMLLPTSPIWPMNYTPMTSNVST
jgi:hypothetical protein